MGRLSIKTIVRKKKETCHMNYKQLLQTYSFIEESYVLTTNDLNVVKSFVDRICVYLNKGKRFCSLKCDSSDFFFASDYSIDDCKDDMNTIRSFLQSIIDSIPHSSVINKIVDICNSISSVGEKDYSKMLSIVREIYSAFQGKIDFDDNIKKLCSVPLTGSQARSYCALDTSILNGLKIKLESYADDLLSGGYSSKKEKTPSLIINNTNNNSNIQKNNVEFDLKLEIENTYKNIEEASLSPSEEKMLRETIAKLEELLKSEESKNKKWNRFKEIVGGVAQFSLKAAELLAPLMAAAWPK